MKAKNPFETALAAGSVRKDMVDYAVWVTDTLDVAWRSAQAVFEDQATPEIALAIYDRLLARLGPLSLPQRKRN